MAGTPACRATCPPSRIPRSPDRSWTRRLDLVERRARGEQAARDVRRAVLFDRAVGVAPAQLVLEQQRLGFVERPLDRVGRVMPEARERTDPSTTTRGVSSRTTLIGICCPMSASDASSRRSRVALRVRSAASRLDGLGQPPGGSNAGARRAITIVRDEVG